MPITLVAFAATLAILCLLNLIIAALSVKALRHRGWRLHHLRRETPATRGMFVLAVGAWAVLALVTAGSFVLGALLWLSGTMPS